MRRALALSLLREQSTDLSSLLLPHRFDPLLLDLVAALLDPASTSSRLSSPHSAPSATRRRTSSPTMPASARSPSPRARASRSRTAAATLRSRRATRTVSPYVLSPSQAVLHEVHADDEADSSSPLAAGQAALPHDHPGARDEDQGQLALCVVRRHGRLHAVRPRLALSHDEAGARA